MQATTQEPGETTKPQVSILARGFSICAPGPLAALAAGRTRSALNAKDPRGEAFRGSLALAPRSSCACRDSNPKPSDP